MKPEIYSHKEGFNITLTRSPVNDPELEYRREAEKWVKKRQGEISRIGRTALNKLATRLKVSPEVTKRIEAEVLAPYEEHKANLKEYEEVLIEALEQESPLSEVTREELKYFQQVLGLTDEDVAGIEESILSEQEAEEVKTHPKTSKSSAFSDEDTPKSQIPNPKSDDLSSEKNVDYTRLRNLLADGKWKEADQETLAVMLKATGREKEGWLNIESIETFPCTDLRTIDRLWVKYSDGRFGFSVQKRIWESVGGKPGKYDEEIYKKFCDRVGWRLKGEWLTYSHISFSLFVAHSGHLPFVLLGFGVGRKILFSRVETCKV
ncbi:MAG: GUN4 domain-containing protein [Symplocastrum torsivum CPER-KK1]|uniref:GUN4 domain-containing protein n=1 Tax=Symplocastrum torsivum CPER-KK1 TaxID=450513 RepID=A0A951PP79_9CYAN|nr:GUN4 domain-containing protein [Symplocastrum torsivum CPER-KK1]